MDIERDARVEIRSFLEQNRKKKYTPPRDVDDIDFSLPLEERLTIIKGPGSRIPFDLVHEGDSYVKNKELDEFMQAVCIFKRVNPHIKFICPSHVFFIIKRMGYVKTIDI